MKRYLCICLLALIALTAVFSASISRTIVFGSETMTFSDSEFSSLLVRYEKKAAPEECGVVVKLFLKSGRYHYLSKAVKLVFPKYFTLPRPDYDLQILKIRYVIEQQIQTFMEGKESLLRVDPFSF